MLVQMALVNAQRSVDRLFEKYDDREGFTSVTINGDLLDLAISGDSHRDDIAARITGIRILSQNDDSGMQLNFKDALIRDVDLDSYEEFMTIREYDQDMRMLIKTQGRKVRELLLISIGKKNLVIQVKGEMTFSDAKRLSERVRENHGSGIL